MTVHLEHSVAAGHRDLPEQEEASSQMEGSLSREKEDGTAVVEHQAPLEKDRDGNRKEIQLSA